MKTASKLNEYEQKTKQFEHNLQEKQTKQEQLKKEIADLQEQKRNQEEIIKEKEQQLYSVTYQLSNVQDQLNVYDQENDQLEIEINDLKKT